LELGQVWYWDYLDGVWKIARQDNLRPGLVLMVAANAGGYDPLFGFTGEKLKKGQVSLDVTSQLLQMIDAQADLQEESERPSEADWKTIVTHCREAAEVGSAIAKSLGLSDRMSILISLAMRLHDWGKAHPAFALGTYRVEPKLTDLAKAPRTPANAWRSLIRFYETDSHGPRPGFRHELVSALAAIELLRQSYPNHAALKGENAALLDMLYAIAEKSKVDEGDSSPTISNSIADELNGLSADDFNLLLYLVACHHGKVRLSLQASPRDQDFPIENSKFSGKGMPIRGVREGDVLPSIRLPDSHGKPVKMPSLTLSLVPASLGLSETYGESWSERMLGLVETLSPFALGYFEAIIRTADGLASAMPEPDGLLAGMSLQIPSEEISTALGVLLEHPADEIPQFDELLEEFYETA
jgi:CRISPR-associated endonuclease/helicase Cas3